MWDEVQEKELEKQVEEEEDMVEEKEVVEEETEDVLELFIDRLQKGKHLVSIATNM